MLAIALPSLASKRGNAASPEREKARYYYLEAVRRQVSGDNAGAYELYKKSSNIDPEYVEALSALGSQRLMNDADTFQTPPMLMRSLAMMKPFIEQYPGDFFEASYYAFLAGRLDSVPEAIRVYERTDSLFPTKTATLFHLADAYMAEKNTEKAVEALDKFERIEGKNAQISLKKITYYIQAQDTLGAIREARALADFSPRNPTFKILMGNVFEALSMPDSAYQCFLKAEEVGPDNGPTKLALAAYYKETGDSIRYDEKTYEALISEDFGLEEKASLVSQYLQRIINDKSAVSRGDTLFNIFSRQFPHEPIVLDLAARYSAAKGDMPNAIEQIGYAIDLKPDEKDFWGQLMTYQLAADKPKDAVKTYDKAAKHIEIDEDMKLLMTQACSMAEDYERAVATYEDLLKEINPHLNASDSLPDRSIPALLTFEQLNKASNLYTMLGDMFSQRGMPRESFIQYENALKFIPDNAMTLNNYAYFMAEAGGDLEKAEKMSKQALDIDPDNPTFLDTYAWILFLKGDAEKALPYQMSAVEKAEQQNDISAELYSHYGDILFHNAEPEEALAAWEKALKITPDDKLLQKKVKNHTYFEK